MSDLRDLFQTVDHHSEEAGKIVRKFFRDNVVEMGATHHVDHQILKVIHSPKGFMESAKRSLVGQLMDEILKVIPITETEEKDGGQNLTTLRIKIAIFKNY